LSDVGVEEVEEVELDAAGDLDGGRVGDVAYPQGEFAEVSEDHAADGADPAGVGAEPVTVCSGPSARLTCRSMRQNTGRARQMTWIRATTFSRIL
jgi:hypothetical protein